MSTSSPSWLAYSNQAWFRPKSEADVPQTGVRNSLRAAISSQIAGTWCCQQPAPRKLSASSQVVLRDRSPLMCRFSAASERSAGGRSTGREIRCSTGTCSYSSSTLATPTASSISSIALGAEMPM